MKLKYILYILYFLFTQYIFTQSSISFTGDFEYGIIGPNCWHKFSPDPTNPKYAPVGLEHRWKLDSIIVRQGKYSLRIEVQPGDTSENGYDRAEVVGMSDPNDNPIFENNNSGTKYYAFSVRLDQNWEPPSLKNSNIKGHGIIAQLQKQNGEVTTGPAFAIQATDRFYATLNAREIHDPKPDDYRYEFSKNDLNVGKWIDFVIKIKYSQYANGEIIVWRRDDENIDFSEILNLQNITTLFYDEENNNEVLDHSWHLGYYRNAQHKMDHPVTNILWIDGFTRADSFNDAVSNAFSNVVNRYNFIITDDMASNGFELLQNYPNPFNTSTIINFYLKNKEFIRLKVYDILGTEVKSLIEGEYERGFYTYNFNAEYLTSGIYLCSLQFKNKIETKKIILIK